MHYFWLAALNRLSVSRYLSCAPVPLRRTGIYPALFPYVWPYIPMTNVELIQINYRLEKNTHRAMIRWTGVVDFESDGTL